MNLDLTSVIAELVRSGPIGLLALWLWYRESQTATVLSELQKEYLKETVKMAGDMKDALRSSTEAFRANNEVQGRASVSAASIAEALRSLETAIDHLGQLITRAEQRIDRLDRGGRP